MSSSKCPWCKKEIALKDWSVHIDSHKDPNYDRKLIREYRHVIPPKDITDNEMVTFAICVSEKLTVLPKPGDYPSGPSIEGGGFIERLLKIRNEYEKEIHSCLLGTMTLEDFIRHATQSQEVNRDKVIKIIYNCLDGLQNIEAQKIRKQLDEYFDIKF